MTAAEMEQVTESLRALGIEAAAAEPEADEDAQVVSWADDLAGFLDAAKNLAPAEAYVGPLLIDEDLVGSLEEDDDPDDPALEPFRKIIEDARALLGQEAGMQAVFEVDGVTHEYYVLTPAARDLFERIEQLVDSLPDDGCTCGHDHDDEHDQHGGLPLLTIE